MTNIYEHLIGKEVLDNDGDILPVISIDRDFGITLEKGDIKSCINGPLSNNTITPNYNEIFDYYIDAIEYGYIDNDIAMSIWKGYPYTPNNYCNACCALSH